MAEVARSGEAAGDATIVDAIETRRSVRAFRPEPVGIETVERLLALASRAPSGSNIQPWQTIVLCGEPLRSLGERLKQLALAGHEEEREFQYYPKTWRDPYLARRRQVGWALYDSLGIARGEKARMAAQHARNFHFFDAPVGLLFTLDRDMETGGWLDLGMFLQTMMLGARGLGLDTCPQVAFTRFPRTIAELVAIPADRILACGMALGYRDHDAPENLFSTPREPVSETTRFILE